MMESRRSIDRCDKQQRSEPAVFEERDNRVANDSALLNLLRIVRVHRKQQMVLLREDERQLDLELLQHKAT